ncbi:hypothetical protein [Bifidobacterium felsineum]|uniref:Uncharacterized protein n=1 Tax=Bifidobacterium felsineum TaxID=2045440 RepID=A0A2M9HII1_9BIFI|nr:hypothetical protein [Bifidobacterium felsineum]PJM76622.1 hypothetical protein CSQ86_07820 [Bifidobacterium felsineum]
MTNSDIIQADFSKAGVTLDDDRPILADASDFIFYAALAMLPIDGTVAGPYMPFWTPLSPWLFLAYAVANWRALPQVWHRFRVFFLFPVLLVVLSLLDWQLVGFHRLPAMISFSGVFGALACLVSLDIALSVKRLSWRRMLDLLILVYWFAFLVGVVQRLSIMLEWTTVRDFFIRLMSRQYISSTSKWGGGRPQFLFAEPSYIGMHLFGVLLPLVWLVRGRDRKRVNRLRVLIVVFAAGSVLMGAGVRIILDSIIALVFVIIEANGWRTWKGRLIAFGELVVTGGVGALSVAVNHRLSSIAELGFDGDGSFYARLWQSLGPGAGALKHPQQLLLGYGAGNLSDATHQGADAAVRALERLGLNASAPKGWYAQVTPMNMFTMSAYTSFFVEFGLIASVLLVVMVLWHVSRNHAWNKTTVCWFLLVVYLYIQFEGYAFYALPLLLWAVAAIKVRPLGSIAGGPQ